MADSSTVKIGKNERSWAIDLISYINSFVQGKDLAIKQAGGENTISNRGNTMFPDVILYGNKTQSVILQGWELKMPDVPIEDSAFIADAQRKARALNLNSCLIWNFTYAALYQRDDSDHFSIVKRWDSTNFIRTRQDVETYRADWEKLLGQIVLEINSYFLSGEFRQTTIGEAISRVTVSSLVQRNKDIVSDSLRTAAVHDSVIDAYIDNWWNSVHAEYELDERDKYKAYAKTIILNWAIRVLFAHIIKTKQNAAMAVNTISYETTPPNANSIFISISNTCDFFNIFSPVKYDHLLPALAWNDIVELSLFLRDNGIDNLDQLTLQSILEDSVNSLKRQVNGQFATPPELATLLARITVRNWEEPVLDCCCGTGTISKAVYMLKKEKTNTESAISSVWACDKNKYPLQAASISMADADTINLISRVFQHNALTLTSGENISFTDPRTGNVVTYSLPMFGAITSNLPFVPFEIIPDDDKAHFRFIRYADQLDGRSDLYCYIALRISSIIKPKGMLGIITSNSWLGTKAGASFISALSNEYAIKQVHISGQGRWFQNAEIVTTIILLQKKPADKPKETLFFLWKKSLKELEKNKELENTLVNSSLLEKELDESVAKVTSYSNEKMNELLEMNVSYNALFHRINWLLSIKEKLIPIGDVFSVFRGSRRGWDAMFYPRAGEHHIEKQYLKKVLLNARRIDSLVAKADADAFCCSDSIDTLRDRHAIGAIEWIERFEGQRNGVGQPLPQVLRRANMYWYEMKDSEIADIVTTMNPDQRLFFAALEHPSFVNQRLIGLKHKSTFPDTELNHALLNSILTMFYVEASGFGRGLGVLDINKDSIKNCFMLNPNLVDEGHREKIVLDFRRLKARTIKKTCEEVFESDREQFEHAVLDAFGIDYLFADIRQSLISLQKTRLAVKEL